MADATRRRTDVGPEGTDAPPLVPGDFLFGVATAGFQVEGGFNGPGEPANNWRSWERAGRVEASGNAVDFWNDPDASLDRAAALGCTSFRMGVEWARVEPAEGEIDRALEEMSNSEGWKAFLESQAKFHHYSMHNAWLIYAQRRDATSGCRSRGARDGDPPESHRRRRPRTGAHGRPR